MAFQYYIAIIGSIVFIELTLSGDNVVEISTTALLVPPDRRRLALSISAIGATGLRLLLIQAMTLLLAIPSLKLFSGLLVLLSAVRFLRTQGCEQSLSLQETSTSLTTEKRGNTRQIALRQQLAHLASRVGSSKLSLTQRKFLLGIVTIILADSIASLDNVVIVGAIGTTARIGGLVLAISLTLSKVLLYIGSALITELLKRRKWATLVASFLLTAIAGEIINSAIAQWFNLTPWLIYGLCILVVVVSARWRYCQTKPRASN